MGWAVGILDNSQLPSRFRAQGELMARHRLTEEEQRRGVERTLESPRTPPQLKKRLQKSQQQLEGKNQESSESRRNVESLGAARSSRSARGTFTHSRSRRRSSSTG